MIGKLGRGVVWLGIASQLAACASTGVLRGALEEPGRPAAPVSFAFKSEVFGDGGTLTATLPSGERFDGKYVQVTSTTTQSVLEPVLSGWDGWWAGWGPFEDPWYDGADYTVFVKNYSGKVIANLLGDRGDTMRCRFRLADPPSGLSGGGVGQCQLGSGDQIHVQF